MKTIAADEREYTQMKTKPFRIALDVIRDLDSNSRSSAFIRGQ